MENTMINTEIKKVEIEDDQTLELKIKEFNYWDALRLLKKYFLGLVLPILREVRSDSDEEVEVDVFKLLDQLMISLDEDELERFSQDFMKNTKIRMSGDENWIDPDEDLGVTEGLVAIKEIAVLNFKTFSKAARVLGLGDLVAQAEEMMEGSQED
tara:strand:+ start:40697 stop:41161 length:465 start_codon:yes stop_codon:yes gene_type:complete